MQIDATKATISFRGARHDWYHNPATKASQPVPRLREIADSLAKDIIKMLK
jgi:hypothetical protein